MASFFALTVYTCVAMKLVSYFQVNKAFRYERNMALLDAKKHKQQSQSQPKSSLANATEITNPITHETKYYQKSDVDETTNGIDERLKPNLAAVDDDELLVLSPEPQVEYPHTLNLNGLSNKYSF